MLQAIILRFINDLRVAGLRISLSESIDALQAVTAVGIERDVLCEALATSLVKEEEDRPLFDEIFARFFAKPRPQLKRKHSEKIGEGAGQRSRAPGMRAHPSEQLPEQQAGKRPTQKQAEQPSAPDQQNRHLNSTQQEPAIGKQELENRDPTPNFKQAKRTVLLDKPFQTFDMHDVEAATQLVEELARRLHGHLSRRYKRHTRGRLDFRRTLRASIPHGGIPIDLRWRSRRPGKPDLVAWCDLSGSVALVSDFLLALVAPAAAYFRRVCTFAYVDRLCEVSFEQGRVVPHEILDLYARSDFGKVLQHFWQRGEEHLLTRNTVVLILGDARNNRRPPRPDLLTRMRDRVKTVVWLNPEPYERWDTGDSVMSRYTPICDLVLGCSNLRELLSALKQAL